MKGKFYTYPKNGHAYRVIQEAKMEDPTTGEWKDSVFYTDGNSAYCMEKKDFFDKFKPVEKEVNNNVNHPAWYTQHPSGVECIEITRYYCFSIGNAIKYLWRAGLKKEMGLEDKQKEIEDLKKAIWYINDRIKQLELENG